MSCSLLNSALGYRFLRVDLAPLEKTPILRTWHTWQEISEHLLNCEYWTAVKMKEQMPLQTTWLVLTDMTLNKRSQRQKNTWPVDPFLSSSKNAKLASRFQSWWDSRSNWPCHLKQLKEADQIYDLMICDTGRQAALACHLWEKGNEQVEPGNIQCTA